MKNSIKLVICVFCTYLSSTAFSQSNVNKYPKVEIIESDTVIVFDLDQGRKLAIINESKKRLEELNAIQNKELTEKDSIIYNQSVIVTKYVKIEKAYDAIIVENKNLEKLCQDEKIILTDEIKKQKRYKWYAIFGGITSTALVTWIAIRN